MFREKLRKIEYFESCGTGLVAVVVCGLAKDERTAELLQPSRKAIKQSVFL